MEYLREKMESRSHAGEDKQRRLIIPDVIVHQEEVVVMVVEVCSQDTCTYGLCAVD